MKTLASQTSPPKVTQPQNHVIATKQPPETQKGSDPVSFLQCSSSCLTDIQELENHRAATFTWGTAIPLLRITNAGIEERLVSDELTNELFFPPSSTVLLERKQAMFHVPVDFENNLTLDAFVDSRAYVRSMAMNWTQ